LADSCLAFATTAAEPCTQLSHDTDIVNVCTDGQVTCYRKKRKNDERTTESGSSITTDALTNLVINEGTLSAENVTQHVPKSTSSKSETIPNAEATIVIPMVTTPVTPGTCVESIRKSGTTLWMSFYNTGMVVRYKSDLTDITSDSRDDVRSRSILYRDFPSDVLDAYRIGVNDLYTVEGEFQQIFRTLYNYSYCPVYLGFDSPIGMWYLSKLISTT
jgi:hypothetical protein